MTSTNQRIATFLLLVLLSMASYASFLAYKNLHTFTEQSQNIESTKILSSLSVALAKERDLSASYLSSKGLLSKEDLEEQRLQVNRLLKEFYDFFQTHNVTPHLKTIMLPLTKLMDIRHAIDTFSVEFDTMFFDFYSHITFYLLKEFETIETPSALTNLTSTLALLYKHSEALAQERGFIAKVLNQHPPFLASDIVIWMNLFSPSDTFNYTSLQHPHVKSAIQNLSKIPENIKLDEEIIRTKAELLAHHKEKYPISSTAWFDLLTQKIELLVESALLVEETLEREKNLLKTDFMFTLFLVGSLWLLSLVSLIFVWNSNASSKEVTIKEDSSLPEVFENTLDTQTHKEPLIENPPLKTTPLPVCQTILVAEDNENKQQLIQKTLEELGFAVIMVSNGLEAVEGRKRDECDMILMDIAMPVMDGVEATHQILAYEAMNQLPHIPIIAMTSNALPGDKERFMKEGLDASITKPLHAKEFLTLLELFFCQKAPSLDTMRDTSILLLKKSPLESTLFKHILSQWSTHIDEATSYEAFKAMVASHHYNLLLFDKEMLLHKEKELSDWLGALAHEGKTQKIYTIMFVDPKEKREETHYFDAVVANQVTKKELEMLIRSFTCKD
ncbi:MAG: response regulator [Sulfurospirillum sp.]|nr:response regulator [Sulfurospirillum sp.]MBP9612602.1 response regulator [Sulfurospirillum sp.]